MSDLIIYGATGYTGSLIATHAKQIGLNFSIAGRSAPKLQILASTLSVPYLIFDLSSPSQLDTALQTTKAKVLLNCAGPFVHTAAPLIDGCIRNGVHYLDIAAELDSYVLAEKRDGEARKAGVMLMPGAGGSVAMFGSLVGRLVQNQSWEKIRSIDIAMAVSGSMSRGSVISASEGVTATALQRAGGILVDVDSSELVEFGFDDGAGSRAAFPVTLPDLVTLWRSTGADNIRTFVHASGGFPSGDLAALPDGPTLGERENSPYQVSAVVTNEDGAVRRAVLHTVNGYTFTALASVEAARRNFGGEMKGGFQTPVDVFGIGFAETIPGSVMSFI